MSLLPKVIYKFLKIPIKISMPSFGEIGKKYKFQMQSQASAILMKNKVGGLILSDFKTYLTAVVIKTVWCQPKGSFIDLWIRIDNPEISPGMYGIMYFDKAFESTECGQAIFFNKQLSRKLNIYMQKNEDRPLLYIICKNQLKIG